jgi:N-acetylneuraminic acid mutarotase
VGGSSINKHIQILTVMLIIATMILSATNFPDTKAQDNQSSWNALTPMPTSRSGLGAAVVNGKIYAIGGLNGGVPVSNNEQYDPVLNSWTVEMPMPTARSGFAIASYNGKIYVIGGTVGNGFVGNNEVYDPATNTWETKASMPTPRSDLSACVVNDEIFLIGGKKYSNTNPYFNETNINEVYNPANDSWTTKTSIPTAAFGYGLAAINEKIYIVGGSQTSTSLQQSGTYVIANQVYDPQKDNWTSATNLPSSVSFGAAAATQDYLAPARLYLAGGYFQNTLTSKTQIYNPSNNSWTIGTSLPSPRANLALVVVNDILYAIGGFDGQNSVNTNEQYKPADYGTIPPKLQITSPENKTYSKVSLAFTINRGTSWIGYNLDNQANETVKESTNSSLLGLSQGQHSIILYANDSQGHMGYSNIVYFSVDSIPPVIKIRVPLNQTYSSTDMELTFIINEKAKELSYSLDGQVNITIIGNVTLPALTDGPHRLTIYATDEVGNAGSTTVYFSISSFPFVAVVAVAAIIIIILASGYLFYKHRKAGKSEQKETRILDNIDE